MTLAAVKQEERSAFPQAIAYSDDVSPGSGPARLGTPNVLFSPGNSWTSGSQTSNPRVRNATMTLAAKVASACEWLRKTFMKRDNVLQALVLYLSAREHEE